MNCPVCKAGPVSELYYDLVPVCNALNQTIEPTPVTRSLLAHLLDIDKLGLKQQSPKAKKDGVTVQWLPAAKLEAGLGRV